MAASAKARRRWLGFVFLTSAAGLLIFGLTAQAPHLRGLAFIAYWLICLLCVVLAMLAALADVRAIGRQARQEQRDLLQNTFQGIESKRIKKTGRPSVQADE